MVYYPYPKAPFLSPEQVVSELDLKPGERVIDFGAGPGYWSIPMAKLVGTGGHIYVTDPKETNLSVIKSKAERLGLDNISYFKAPYDCKVLPVQTKVDLILCSNILSLVSSPIEVLKSIRRLAQGGTRLVIIDWNDKTPVGPDANERVNTHELIGNLDKLGFEFKKLLSAGAHHTGLYFEYKK